MRRLNLFHAQSRFDIPFIVVGLHSLAFYLTGLKHIFTIGVVFSQYGASRFRKTGSFVSSNRT